jgi:hypothetical protein
MQANDRFRSFSPFLAERKREREREKNFLSLIYSANTLPSDVTVISIGA